MEKSDENSNLFDGGLPRALINLGEPSSECRQQAVNRQWDDFYILKLESLRKQKADIDPEWASLRNEPGEPAKIKALDEVYAEKFRGLNRSLKQVREQLQILEKGGF